jgi:hypothetical protein
MDTLFASATRKAGSSEFVPESDRVLLESAGVSFDESGCPVWYTAEEWFDALDNRLIARFGEDFRKTVNESRAEWNKKGVWQFDPL